MPFPLAALSRVFLFRWRVSFVGPTLLKYGRIEGVERSRAMARGETLIHFLVTIDVIIDHVDLAF
ncbi:hypothetical protein KDAU_69520 [Dictyobacter aurantiacus]|uniref:Uncharacterized protein n=1 Tax=Dictyobacter aurantiacus TaxID=1936993 RepID=A0A401ZRZ9_9CHLR|nr:hypothetical protein KDAU_69520 [Dictyobacter aurantiacus]